ncbi:Hint domain-containing protein [Cochlodiniinecator piscidefendens]|uniref:Hint domain-containing protein n=1 Tax=Cochlodiniinecator piscidefendens TaxID=2715756 RepID=UPI00140B87B9|nr:Hint domain-containing protein [Cochlodiniinecator piscidefendens]
MALENVLVYNFASGDNTYPHSGTFTVGVAGQVTIDDSNGSDDGVFGDFTHTGGADVPDQDVSASSVSGINVGDTIDLRYKYTITGSDGSNGTIYFVATNNAANYGPLFVSNQPLDPAVTYTFGTFNTDGAVAYARLVPCFTSGTWIETAKGPRLIDSLKEGDLILTRDNGFQPMRWIGRCTVPAAGKTSPVHIAAHVLGNDRGLLVSPNHRMLIEAAIADMYFGERELLVSAKHLLTTPGITRRVGGMVTYIHILFDEHQVVLANGAYSESFFPGPVGLNSLAHETRQEVLELFPELRSNTPKGFEQTARMCLTQKEATVLQQLVA